MKQLIVNADDFGMTEGVNRGILEAHRGGIVTSTTLLANGEAFASAVALCRDAPRLGVGVHLNLSEGLPVLPPAASARTRSTLLNAQGRLHLTPGKLFAAIAARRVLLADVEGELRAQVRKAIDAGIVPTHLDGHMHVHVLPGVSEIAVQLARESRIPAIRCPVERLGNPLRGSPGPAGGTADGRAPRAPEGREAPRAPHRQGSTKRNLIAFGVSAAALRLRWLARRAGLLYPAHFYGIAQTGVLDGAAVERILRALPETPAPCELMCHPGYVDATLAAVGGELQGQRQTELAALTSPAIIEVVKQSGIELVTFADLARRKDKESQTRRDG